MSDRHLQLIEQAASARRENRLLDARRDLVEAIDLCREDGSRRDLIRALKGLGQIERDLGRTEAARALYEEAVGICRGEPDALELAHTIRHLGDIYQGAGRLTLAESCYDEALLLYRGHKGTLPLDLANAIRSAAVLKERAGEPDAAMGLWKEAGELYKSVDVQAGVAECSARLALLKR